MEKLTSSDKIYLDRANTKESEVNQYLNARDGIVEVVEYRDCSGYGSKTRLFYCIDSKHEAKAIIRQVYRDTDKEWREESLHFDSDSFEYFEKLMKGEGETVRSYMGEIYGK